MNAIQVLLKDHEEIREYFRQYDEAADRAKKARQKAVDDAIKELESHMQLEEQIFYPAVRAKAGKELMAVLLEGIEEHGVAKFLIGQLRSGGHEDEIAEARFKVLMESVMHHVKEEEKELLPEAKKLLAPDLDRLGEQMEQLEKQIEG